MSDREKILDQEVSDLLGRAKEIDKVEGARFGKHRRGELPDELRRWEDRLAKLRETKQALEQEARNRAARRAWATSACRGEDEDATEPCVSDAVGKAMPRAKAERNFTDWTRRS